MEMALNAKIAQYDEDMAARLDAFKIFSSPLLPMPEGL